MPNRQIRRIRAALTHALTDPLLMNEIPIPSQTVAGWLEGGDWPSRLGRCLPLKARFTCAQALDVCQDLLDSLSAPAEGWLAFSFAYSKNIMFPEESFVPRAEQYGGGARVFLTVLQVLFAFEREELPFDPSLDFAFLPIDEMNDADDREKYQHFLDIFRTQFVYEHLRLGMEVTPYPLLAHVAQVHHIAMHAARGLNQGGMPVNLTLVSTAAAGHDLGKFGCKDPKRVPYQHYYYTEQWYRARQMNLAGRIAGNHSTWDLEIESLSAESLCLIYADFRVKQFRNAAGEEITQVYSLHDSFQVILDKLDNVDDAKRRRYTFVYGKLRDFEDYLRRLGVDVDFSGHAAPPYEPKPAALLDPEEMTEDMTLWAVEHNLRLMRRLNSERHFSNILEAAHSEKDWKKLRAYLNILEEYSTYLSQHQKVRVLLFCYELLMHREGVIRHQAAALMGALIAGFDLRYQKEVPPEVTKEPDRLTPHSLWSMALDMLISPDHKVTAQHRSRIGYSAKLVIRSLLKNSRSQDIQPFLQELVRRYTAPREVDEETAFVLLNAFPVFAFNLCSEEDLDQLTQFLGYFCLHSEQYHVQVSALRFLVRLTDVLPEDGPCRQSAGRVAIRLYSQEDPILTFLQYRILSNAGLDTRQQEAVLDREEVIGEIMRENLKTSMHWSVKVVGVALLVDQVLRRHNGSLANIAAHMANLIRISEWAVVRHKAGGALVDLMPHLGPDQRNEIVLELTRSLDGSEYEFSREIPDYLGALALYCEPEALEGLIDQLQALTGSVNARTVAGALGVAGSMLAYHPDYRDRFFQSEEAYLRREKRLLGLILAGLAHFRFSVRQEAMLIVGKTVFGAKSLTLEDKAHLFSLCAKKLRFLLSEEPGGDLTFFYRAAALSHIYRFLSLYRMDHGSPPFEKPGKVAFFPGTFDPFTLSHKGIVQEIRDMGFEVYLAVDEFSWSKQAQPHLIRRNIVNMSVAGEFGVYLFPQDMAVNIANPQDLKALTGLFAGRELFITAGSDVVRNASSYQAAPQPYSIHTMNHVIFSRLEEGSATVQADAEAQSVITGQVVHLTLPAHLEDISSTRIRDNVDLNRDISYLVDPVVKDFLYENSLYLREPSYKALEGVEGLRFTQQPWLDPGLLSELTSAGADPDLVPVWAEIMAAKDQIVLLRDSTAGNQPLGFLSCRIVAPDDLFSALDSLELADEVRQSTSGQILILTGVYPLAVRQDQDVAQLLLAEALAVSMAESCGYALFRPRGDCPAEVLDTLRRLGFLDTKARPGGASLAVDMRAPIVLTLNLGTTIKSPLSRDAVLLRTIQENRRRLLETMCRFYPGHLVLPLSAEVIHHHLVEKITALNGVPDTVTVPRRLGASMCVPFGKILRSKVIPNTVTKTLHTDKVFSPDGTQSEIEAFSQYTPIPSQMRIIKSFRRPVILVDDLLHEGNRIQALDPHFKGEGVEVQMVLVGVLTARGRDLMAYQDHPVDSVYFLPNLRQWFVESALYPFVGGDTVRRSSNPVPGLQPAINRFLPYALPARAENCSKQTIYQFSQCCLENAMSMFQVLEEAYREEYARNLTLSRLSEAVILPLCPDKGSRVAYDPNLPVSVYLQNDWELLQRMRELGT